jgi:hypothetical protein
MAASDEQRAMRFVELLANRAASSGLSAWRWVTLNIGWRRVFIDTVSTFLDEINRESVSVRPIDERQEDERIRQMCDYLTPRQRLKVYRQLYALGCRIDRINYSIEKVTRARI